MTFDEMIKRVLSEHPLVAVHQLIEIVRKNWRHPLTPEELALMGRMWEKRSNVKLIREIADNIAPYPPTDSIDIKKGWRVALLHVAGIIEDGGGDGDGEPVLETWDDPIAMRKEK